AERGRWLPGRALRVDRRIPRPRRARRAPGDVAARPRPLEVVAADPAVDVADLADDVEARTRPRLHRLEPDLRQRHAARGDLGMREAAVAGDRERPFGRGARQSAALAAHELAHRARGRNPGRLADRLGEPLREPALAEKPAAAGRPAREE